MNTRILIVLQLFIGTTLFAQDSLKYDYAVLNILDQRNKIFINYSNGELKKLTIQEGDDVRQKDTYLQSIDKIVFKAFELLNSQGYELAGMLLTPAHSSLESDLREYYFKKPKGK